MYSGETDFLSPLVSYFAGEIMCSSLGLAIVVISMYKINLSQVKGAAGAFWLSSAVGYGMLLAYGMQGTTHPSLETIVVRQVLQSLGVSTMEFAFSIINVALGNMSSLLELRSRALRIAWLLYSLTHIPLALMVTFLQREFGKEDNLVFWNYMWHWPVQAINLLVFALHLQFIREDLRKRTLSVRTSLMLNAVLSRFTDFCVSYALSMIPTFMLMVLSVLDVLGLWTPLANKFCVAAFGMFATLRIFAFVHCVYVFRPHWVVMVTSFVQVFPSVSNTGAELPHRGGGEGDANNDEGHAGAMQDVGVAVQREYFPWVDMHESGLEPAPGATAVLTRRTSAAVGA